MAPRGWPSVCVPAPVYRPAPLYQILEYLETALGLDHLQALPPAVNRDARGVIAPIFQPGEAVQQNGGSLLPSDKSDNTAHGISLLFLYSKVVVYHVPPSPGNLNSPCPGG